jgi:cell division protein FtsQ
MMDGMTHDDDAAPGLARHLLASSLARRVALISGLLVVAGAPWWGRHGLGALAFFRVRSVEVHGVRYLAAGDVVARLRVDTTASVWDDPAPWETRLRGMPQVRAATISRRMPGTLVVRLRERLPVALVPTPAGLRAYDALATALPIDPTRTDLDLPVAGRADPQILRLLDAVREELPGLFARISDVRRAPAGDLIITLADAVVRAPANVGIGRLAELLPVTADLARRHARGAELDLRYRDQVVARLP